MVAPSESKGNPNQTQDLISQHDYRSTADLKNELAVFRGSFQDTNWTPNMKIGIDSYRKFTDEKSEIQPLDIQIQDQSFNNSLFRYYDEERTVAKD